MTTATTKTRVSRGVISAATLKAWITALTDGSVTIRKNLGGTERPLTAVVVNGKTTWEYSPLGLLIDLAVPGFWVQNYQSKLHDDTFYYVPTKNGKLTVDDMIFGNRVMPANLAIEVSNLYRDGFSVETIAAFIEDHRDEILAYRP